VKVIDEITKHEMGPLVNYLRITGLKVGSQLQESWTGMETDRPLSRMGKQQYLQIIGSSVF